MRFLLAALLLFLVGWTLKRTADAADRDIGPAGFRRGMLHGALMPLALPNLAVGWDVPIYATNNDGVPYKLGYTVGVNACGALFFGFFFWRLNRYRKRLQQMRMAAK